MIDELDDQNELMVTATPNRELPRIPTETEAAFEAGQQRVLRELRIGDARRRQPEVKPLDWAESARSLCARPQRAKITGGYVTRRFTPGLPSPRRYRGGNRTFPVSSSRRHL